MEGRLSLQLRAAFLCGPRSPLVSFLIHLLLISHCSRKCLFFFFILFSLCPTTTATATATTLSPAPAFLHPTQGL